MDIIKKFLLVICGFFIVGASVSAQNQDFFSTSKSNSKAKRYEQSLQIPDTDLSQMSTEQLIQAYVDCPLTGYMFGYNTFQSGFERVYNEFNGLQELLQRKDAAKKVIEYYTKIRVDGYDKNWDDIKKGTFTFQFMYIEILLCQPEILNQLSKSELKYLIKELLNKTQMKVIHQDIHSIIGISFCTYTLFNLLVKFDSVFAEECRKNNYMQNFIITGRLNNEMILDKIIGYSRNITQN